MARKKTTKKTSRQRSQQNRQTERKYKRNFLKQVIVRCDFASHIGALDTQVPNAIVRAIKKRFPIEEPKKQLMQQFSFSPTTGIQQSQHEVVQWVFHSKNHDKQATLTGEAMFIEYKRYHSFDILKEDFLAIASAIFGTITGVQLQRLGLRYIDNIEFPREKNPTEWSQYLQPDLLAAFSVAEDRSAITRAFHVLECKYGDMNLRFQYGMPNPDFPAVIKQKIFSLDHDAHCTQLLERADISHYLDSFHDRINASFENVITDGLRTKMGIING